MANTNEQTKVLTAALARVLDADTLAKILSYIGEAKQQIDQQIATLHPFVSAVVTESEYAELVESGEIVDGRFYAVYPAPEEEESNETTEEQA